MAAWSPQRRGPDTTIDGIPKSQHSRRMVPVSRSQNALAWGPRTGVLRTVRLIAAGARSTPSESMLSRSWITNRCGWSPGTISRNCCVGQPLEIARLYRARPHRDGGRRQRMGRRPSPQPSVLHHGLEDTLVGDHRLDAVTVLHYGRRTCTGEHAEHSHELVQVP